MMGTTSDMESNADILYPSITICSRRESDEYMTSYNMSSMSQRSLNLSNIFVRLELYVRDINGDIKNILLETNNIKGENRYKIMVILINKYSMTFSKNFQENNLWTICSLE